MYLFGRIIEVLNIEIGLILRVLISVVHVFIVCVVKGRIEGVSGGGRITQVMRVISIGD